MESIHICLHHSNQCLYLSILPCQTKVTLCKVMYIFVPSGTFRQLRKKRIVNFARFAHKNLLPTHIDPKSVCIIFLAHISLSSCSFKAFVVLLLLLYLILFISKPHTIVYDEEEKEGEMRERESFLFGFS